MFTLSFSFSIIIAPLHIIYVIPSINVNLYLVCYLVTSLFSRETERNFAVKNVDPRKCDLLFAGLELLLAT